MSSRPRFCCSSLGRRLACRIRGSTVRRRWVRLRSRIWSGVTGWRAVLSRPDVAPPPAGFASGTGGADPVEPTAGPAADNFDRAVPPALQIAASWAWRVILVGALIYLLGRVAGY